ncbi:hypothetical protein DYB32_007677, partial [Aphanomyces invadans]
SRLSMEYNDTWLQLWYGTVNYSQWLKSHRLYNDTQRQSPPVPVAGHVAYTYPNGDTYDGEFRNQMRHGRGKYVVANTSHTYEGQWEADQRHGHGTLNDMQDGHGSNYSHISKETKEGRWIRNRVVEGKHEQWIILYPNKDKYIGMCQGGRPWGQGDWNENRFDGTGVYTDADGSVYEGEFRRGLKHGMGKLTNPSDVYQGEFQNGERWGVGTLA